MSNSLFDVKVDPDLHKVDLRYVEEVINRKQLRSKLPKDINEAFRYMTNKKSDIYKYRYVNKAVLELAIRAVNTAISISEKELEDITYYYKEGLVSEYEYRDALNTYGPFTFTGYYNSRITSIVYKVCAVIPLLVKCLGQFDYKSYFTVLNDEDRTLYPYQQVTYLPSDELKRICGDHTASDYITIMNCLRLSNLAKVISHHWKFKSIQFNELTGQYQEYGEGIAKPIYVTKELINAVATESEVIAIPSNGVFDVTVSRLNRLSLPYFSAIYGILKLQVSKNLYEAAQSRIDLGGCIRELVEDAEKETDNYLRYRYVNSVPIKVKTPDGIKTINMSNQSAGIAVAIYEFDVFTLLKYTIDSYSNRLHTCITRFSSEMRPHLKMNGKPIADIDIQSCQPMLFVSLLAENGYPEFAEEVGDRDFYQYLKSLIKHSEYELSEFESKDERNDYKLMYMHSGYSTGSEFRKFIKALSRRLPEYKRFEFIEFMKNLVDGNSDLNKKLGFIVTTRERRSATGRTTIYAPSALPWRLQKKEVEIMFGENGVIQTLIDNGIHTVTTIHDAILVPKEYGELAQKLMQSVFERAIQGEDYGLKIVAKMEIITDSNLEFE